LASRFHHHRNFGSRRRAASLADLPATRGAADCGEYRQAAGASAQGFFSVAMPQQPLSLNTGVSVFEISFAFHQIGFLSGRILKNGHESFCPKWTRL
jgi:hypothetical protein